MTEGDKEQVGAKTPGAVIGKGKSDLLEEYIQQGFISKEIVLGSLKVVVRTLLLDEFQEVNKKASEWSGQSEIYFRSAYTKELLSRSIITWDSKKLPVETLLQLLGKKGSGLVQKLSNEYNELEDQVNKFLKMSGDDLKNSLTTPLAG
jgi:hypothetical protein